MTVAFPHPIEQLVAKVFPRAKRQRGVVLDKLIEAPHRMVPQRCFPAEGFRVLATCLFRKA